MQGELQRLQLLRHRGGLLVEFIATGLNLPALSFCVHRIKVEVVVLMVVHVRGYPARCAFQVGRQFNNRFDE